MAKLGQRSCPKRRTVSIFSLTHKLCEVPHRNVAASEPSRFPLKKERSAPPPCPSTAQIALNCPDRACGRIRRGTDEEPKDVSANYGAERDAAHARRWWCCFCAGRAGLYRARRAAVLWPATLFARRAVAG